jgi:3-methyladenine DNA glycosylase AlkD
MLENLILELREHASPERAQSSLRYFKTGKGEYGEGDKFLGITVPIQRKIAKKYYKTLTLQDVEKLLDNQFHELRLTGLIILSEMYKKSKKERLTQRRIFEFYLKKINRINNWDLVDISAPAIIGDFVMKSGEDILMQLAKSKNMWERRIAIISTFAMISKRKFGETLALSNYLLHDKQDLIHKAVGWALREVGKKNPETLRIFLSTRYKEMPRTMLRYAIEKLPEEERKQWLKGLM